VYSWGVNRGKLGHSDLANRTTPELISALAGKRAVQVACGALHSLVLTEDNVLYSFGYVRHHIRRRARSMAYSLSLALLA
jgi:E3 ubiquitin-protein ligase HERC2